MKSFKTPYVVFSLMFIFAPVANAGGPVVFHKGDPHFINHFPDPVNLRSGNLYLPAIDIKIPASNVNLTMERFYNSFMSNKEGPLGFGWRHNYMTRVRELTNGTIQIEESDGFLTTFVPTEHLKKRLASEITSKRRKADSVSSGLRSDDHYKNYEAKMTGDTRYLLEQIKIYMPAERSPLGSYFSSQRSNQVLLKQETGYVRTYLSGSKEYFGNDGLLKRQEDKNSNFIGLEYKGKRLARIYDRMGLSLEIKTLPNGRIQAVKDHAGRSFQYFYDRNGNLAKTVDFSKETEIYAYDRMHKLTGITLRNGARIGIDYDNRMRVVRQTGPGPKNTSYGYGKEEGVAFGEVTDSRGGKTVFKFDNQNGRTIESNALGQSKTTYVNPKTGKLERFVDEAGTASYFKHDENGNLTQIQDPSGYSKSYEYGGPYGMLTAINEGGATTRFSYDQKGNLIFRELPTGGKYMYRYDVHGNLLSYTDPKGNTFSFKYDQHGWMTESGDPLGNYTRYENDALGRLSKQTDPNGGSLNFAYDNSNNVVSIKDPSGRTSTFKYDFNGKLIEAVDARGGKTSYGYNEMGLVAYETDPTGATYRFSYDPMGNLAKLTDPLGNSYNYGYDPLNRLVEEKNPLGQTVKYSYDAAGKLKSLTDVEGMTENYRYDPAGRFAGFDNPSYGGSYAWEKDEVRFKDARGNVTKYSMDQSGRVTKEVLPNGATKEFRWDHDSRLVWEKSSAGKEIRYKYDPNGRLIEATDSDNTTVKYAWDGTGNLVESTDENGRKWSFRYDGVGRLTEANTPEGGKYEMAYNARGDIASIKDPRNQTQNFRYDMAGKLLARVYADNSAEKIAYDRAGRQISKTMPDGSTLYFEFDSANNLTKVSNASGSFNQYSYDAKGRIVNARNNFVSLSYKYDTLGRLIQEKDDKRGVATNFAYDQFGKIKQISDGQKPVARYSYDGFGSVIGIRDERGKNFKFEYDGEGLPRRITYPNSMIAEYEYGKGPLVSLVRTTGAGKAKIFEAQYEYDRAGNLTGEKTARGKKEYSYDALGRLLQASSGSKGYVYDYDKTGNRIIEKTGSAQNAYQYDPLGRLISKGSTAYGYNKSGDLVSKKSAGAEFGYGYNAFGQLDKVTKNGRTVFEAAYDPFGRKYYSVTNGKKTYFRYHVINRIIEETHEGRRLKTLIHHDDRFPDWPLEIIANGKSLYPVIDGRGNTIKLVSDTGQVVESFAFEPFGKPLKKIANRDLTFASRPYDDETGLLDYRYRYYDPETGRFITRDPMSPASGFNPYVYPSNNPLKYRDPLGLVGFSGIENRSPVVNAGTGSGPYGAGPGPNAGGTGATAATTATNAKTSGDPGMQTKKNSTLRIYLYGIGVPFLVKQLSKLTKKDLFGYTASFINLVPEMLKDNPLSKLGLQVTQSLLGLTSSYGSGFSKGPKDVATNFEEFKRDMVLFSKGDITEDKFLEKWGENGRITGISRSGLCDVVVSWKEGDNLANKSYSICDIQKELEELDAAKKKTQTTAPTISNPVDARKSPVDERKATTSVSPAAPAQPASPAAVPSSPDPRDAR